MKVLYIVSAFPVLTETFVLREVRALQRLGMTVRIAQLRPLTGPQAHGFEDLEPSVIPGWELRRVLYGLWFLLKRRRKLRRALSLICKCLGMPRQLVKLLYVLVISAGVARHLEGEGVQHVRAHHLHTEAVAAYFIADLLGISYSFTCHTIKTVFPREVIRLVSTAATPVIADTFQVSAFLRGLGAFAENVHVIRNGIDLRDFVFTNEDVRQDDLPILLSVGRLDRKKGFHVLLHACGQLKAAGIRFRCIIVGDGTEARMLEQLRESLELTEHVEFKGNLPISKLQTYYASSTVLVAPSILAEDGETDGLPTVIVEALASGLPVVASHTAAIPELIQDGITGVLSVPNDPAALAASLTRVLNSAEMRRLLRIRGRQQIVAEYNINSNVKQLMALIKSTTPKATSLSAEESLGVLECADAASPELLMTRLGK